MRGVGAGVARLAFEYPLWIMCCRYRLLTPPEQETCDKRRPTI